MSRPLGYTETIFNMILPYNGFTVVQAVTLKGNITSMNFKLAVASLQKKFKILQSGVVVKDSIPSFDTIKDNEKIFFQTNYDEKSTETTKEDVFSNDLAQAYQLFLKAPEGFKTGLLWKITLIHDEKRDEFDIILCCSHLICDGKSICTLMGELIKFIELINKKEEFTIEEVDIGPPMDRLISKIEYQQKEIQKKEMGEVLFDDVSMTKPAQQKIILKQLSGEKLIKLCKENKITINSLIYAAYFVSYIEAYCNAKDHQFFNITVPVCLRKKSMTPETTIGLFISNVDFPVEWLDEHKNVENIWKLASIINEGVQKGLNEDEYLVRVHPNTLPPPESKFGRNLFPCLSNLGRVDGLIELKEYALNGLYTSTSCPMFGPVTMCHLATMKDQLYFTFTSVSPIHSEERLKNISEGTLKMLEKLSQ